VIITRFLGNELRTGITGYTLSVWGRLIVIK
jgi:hypothetical protein